MKRLLVFVFLLVMGIAVNAFAANVMPTQSWSFTIQPDLESPYVTDMYPADNAIGVSPVTETRCVVRDDDSGVDVDSIVMKINGVVVSAEITGDKNAYTVKYTPITPFVSGFKNIITIDADDLAL